MKRPLTYEEYFDIDPRKDGHLSLNEGDKMLASSKGATTYDEFLKDKESPNIFENELLALEYKFWESDKDKEERLKKIWIELKRKNALGAGQQRSPQ